MAATGSEARGHLAVLWLRGKGDLRLSDNPALTAAAGATGQVTLLPVFCLDPREFAPRLDPDQEGEQPGSQAAPLLEPGVPRLGPWRTRYLLQALHALRTDLRALGSDLVMRVGVPERELPGALQAAMQAAPTPINDVSIHYTWALPIEALAVEEDVQQAVQACAKANGASCSVHAHWSHTLYALEDLPYQAMAAAAGGSSTRNNTCPVARPPTASPGRVVPTWLQHLPPVMTDFRKRLSAAGTRVQAPLPAPATLPPLPAPFTATGSAGGAIPASVAEAYDAGGAGGALGVVSQLTGVAFSDSLSCEGPDDPRSAFRLHGGERAALARLRAYVWGREEGQGDPQRPPELQPPSLRYYTDSRAQAVGDWSSTKLSAALAMGCISPRTVWWEVAAVRDAAVAADVPQAACDWLGMHLQIRDFYILTALKAGPQLMSASGIQGGPARSWSRDAARFHAWARGRTGLPFVDACMRELAGSGWMSNRGRQNVASLLAKELCVDWRLGAALFECLLVDHDPAVNWCNWNYFAGTGNDPRNRRFKTVTQGMQYDADAELVRAWVPELAGLPVLYRHAPWTMTENDARQHAFVPGSTYPEPIVDPLSQTGVLPVQDGGAKGSSSAKRRNARKQAQVQVPFAAPSTQG